MTYSNLQSSVWKRQSNRQHRARFLLIIWKLLTMAENDLDQDDFRHRKFFSYKEFEIALQTFQKKHNTQFVKTSSVRLTSTSSDQLREQFVYSSVRFVCKQGRSKHKSKAKISDSNGKKTRPEQKSYKVGESASHLNLNLEVNRTQSSAKSQSHYTLFF